MKIFKFKIYDEPKRYKYFRHGKIKKIVYKNGDEIFGGQGKALEVGKPQVEDDLHNIEKIVVESKFQKRETEPYPNFMEIRWSFNCADSKAQEFLKSQGVEYKQLPLEVTNKRDHTYNVIFFNELSNLIDLKKSNLYIAKDKFVKTIGLNYFSPIDSKIVLKRKALQLKGIFGLKESASLICDEETKKVLEKSGLTGFYFEELQIAEK